MTTTARTYYGNVEIPAGCHYCHTGYSHCELSGDAGAIDEMLRRLEERQPVRVRRLPGGHLDVRGQAYDL